MTQVRSRHVGAVGERIAARFLEHRGLPVVGRNIYVDRDEIDIIYRGHSGLVAVEVKTVTGGADPFDGLDDEKMRRFRRAVAGYQRPIVGIDGIGVRFSRNGVEVRWLRGVG